MIFSFRRYERFRSELDHFGLIYYVYKKSKIYISYFESAKNADHILKTDIFKLINFFTDLFSGCASTMGEESVKTRASNCLKYESIKSINLSNWFIKYSFRFCNMIVNDHEKSVKIMSYLFYVFVFEINSFKKSWGRLLNIWSSKLCFRVRVLTDFDLLTHHVIVIS